jgi:peptidylprolyl isomerase
MKKINSREVSMPTAKPGDVVRIHYEVRLRDGELFEKTSERQPLEFRIGDNRLLPAFEEAVVGMQLGDEKIAEVPSGQAFGPRKKNCIFKVDQRDLPNEIVLSIGQQLQIPRPKNRPIVVTVTEISEDYVTLDANHPLAGKDLVFEIKLVEIV